MSLDESQAKVLADLKRKRGVIKASLTRVQTFINKFNPREDAITLLEFRQEELPHINRKFDDIQCQIELINVDNLEESDQAREMFETDYYAIRSQLQEMINIEKSNNSSMNNVSIGATNISSNKARLAPISLPRFDGNIQDWRSFFDCYKAMVHNDDTYPPA